MSIFYIFLYISEGKFSIYSCCGTGKQNIFCSSDLVQLVSSLYINQTWVVTTLPYLCCCSVVSVGGQTCVPDFLGTRVYVVYWGVEIPMEDSAVRWVDHVVEIHWLRGHEVGCGTVVAPLEEKGWPFVK